MKCFYHSADLDGHCSGAIVKMKYPECELIGIDYGQPFPWEKITDPEEEVFMVDFSLQPFEEMIRLHGICKLIWIDHHIAAIREASRTEYDVIIKGRRMDGQAACQLCWEWCYPGKAVPRAVFLLGRYDVWDHTDPDTLPFQYAVRLYNTTPGLSLTEKYGEDKNMISYIGVFSWDSYLTDKHCSDRNPQWQYALSQGRTILAYITSENAKYCRAGSFEAEVGGLKCICVNRLMASSQVFESVWDPEKYQAMAAFGLRADGKWTVSLYSTREDVDVSVVCKALGGGGHKGAAGFQSEFLLVTKDPAVAMEMLKRAVN
jgi:oligoribonuclease NrnB/cAMP/cGMP phosphodiesterase (DHH superfamily)